MENMLRDILSKYYDNSEEKDQTKKNISSRRKAKIIHTIYHKNKEFRKHHWFHTDCLNITTIIRGMNILDNIFNFQLILNKKIYFPGIGLFRLEPEEKLKEYEFKRDFSSIKILGLKNDEQEKDSLKGFITKEGKLDYKKFTTSLLTIKEDKMIGYSNIETKTNKVNKKILEHLNIDNLQIKKEIGYGGSFEFEDIVKESEKYKEYSILKYIENYIDFGDMIYEKQILEDLLLVVGYIENNIDTYFKRDNIL